MPAGGMVARMERKKNWLGPAAMAAAVVAAALVAVVVLLRTDTTGTGSGPPQFNYDLETVRKTNPALIRYRQVRKLDTGLAVAYALARSRDGRLYVGGADAAGKGLIRVADDDRGAAFVTLASTDRPVTCLALGDGLIYAGMTGEVLVLGPAGQVQRSWSFPDKATLTSIAVAPGGDVFIAEYTHRCIHRMTSDGRRVGQITGTDGEGNQDGFVLPSPHFDIAVQAGTDGPQLVVANPGRHRLEVRDLDGHFISAWGRSGIDIESFCGCCNPVNFALLADGRVVTAEKGLPRVKVMRAGGALDGVVVGAESFPVAYACINRNDCMDPGMDVAVGAGGEILVLEPHTKQVLVFAEKSGAKPE